MCGRFVNTTNINKIKKIFEIKEPLNSNEDIISYNIAPTQDVNIILNHATLNIEVVNWGTQFINKTNNHTVTVINSRLETVNEKILFKGNIGRIRDIKTHKSGDLYLMSDRGELWRMHK